MPTGEIQTLIKTQLRDLRTDMLKYEGVVIENGRIHESNDALKAQLEAQLYLSRGLDEQITALRQSEINLRERSGQLERELSELRDSARDSESDPLELELEMNDLRQQLGKAKDDLEAANAKADKTEQLRVELEQEASKHKVCSAVLFRLHDLTYHRNGMMLQKVCFSRLGQLQNRRRR